MLSFVKHILGKLIFNYDSELALRAAQERGKLIERSKHKEHDGVPHCPVCDTMLRQIVAGGHALYVCPLEALHPFERITSPVLPSWSERERVTDPTQEIAPRPTGTAMQIWRKEHAVVIDTKHINAIRAKNKVRMKHG